MSEWNGFGGLDLSDVEAEKARLRPGAYICKITAAEVKATKDNKGRQVVVSFVSESGDGEIQDWINVANASADAERIGRQKLKSLLIACGHPNPDKPGDVESIKGRRIGVRVEPGEDYRDAVTNELKPGGAKVRRSGAYFLPDDATQVLGPSAAKPRSAPPSQSRSVFDDAIPF